ncbi:ORF6N domain-containing protein [Flavobacterium sp. J49]|uniref:ORF6N domain-containing protein n=1 Tax=Flavobacterium sp. J49 TaxID=2718534 RepID=UPI001594247F|nr:ORF6N domain-containing protein [Flavobacterium sp. J49]MBF6641091.1 ORF6N domain-containing protein [Flavobacterium sp. J49]NIC02338.1 ORF6N domain-containing protein [Flavobacterium sp. J49]
MEIEVIQHKIYEIRGHKVMLDFHLAELYNVETRVLKQAVRRNSNRFPTDFMFALSENEINQLVSQSVIPSKSYFGGAFPFAFTEQGIAMLSSVLNSEKAIEINISIIRAFVTIRQFSLSYSELKSRIEEIESQFPDIYKALNYLVDKDANNKTERNKIGYKK